MSQIAGELYDGKSSHHWPATLRLVGEGELRLSWEEGSDDYLLGAVSVTSRLGNTPRYFTLPDGKKFETRDNDAVDALLRQHQQHGWSAWVHKLESRWHYVMLSLVVVVAFVWGMLQYGLPAAAKGIAHHLPPSVTDSVSDETLSYLDKHLFDPSQLPESTQKRLQTSFSRISGGLDTGHRFQLQFRKGGKTLGANAFALPSGTIVMTDELVALSNNDEELIAILAHEVGHVVHRHGLRQT
ncbi:MAG: M48 family metallopeptidase, partial [Pseudomonadota bacterium]